MNDIALSIDKMRHLSKLGLDISGASMKWVPNIAPSNELIGYELQVNIDIEEDEIPAFTVSDLLKLLPRWQMNSCSDGYEIHVIPNNWDMCIAFPSAKGNSILGVVYQIILTLKRKNLL